MDRIEIERLTIESLVFNPKIDIPEFQRKFRWSKDKQKKLIDSIKKNYPIGVIITYRSSDDEIFILDGLQRLTTIKKFINEPNSIFSWTDLISDKSDYNYAEKLIDIINVSNMTENKKTNLKNVLRKIYTNYDMKDYLLFLTDFVDLVNYHKAKRVEEFSYKELETVYQEFKAIFNVYNVIIPVIYYKGKIDDVAEIFEKMNTGSVTLSKYEVFAAAWNDIKFNLDDKQYEKLRKYFEIQKSIIKNEFMKTDYSFESKDNIYNLSEIFIALSYKILNSGLKNIEGLIPKVKKVYVNKNKGYFTKDELFHEIISAIMISEYNRVDKLVKKIRISETSELVNFFISVSEKIIEIYPKVYQLFVRNGYKKNKLYYLFLFEIVGFFNYYYYIDGYKVVERSILNEELYYKLTDFKYMESNEWFINKNRQVSFINEKLEMLNAMSKV